MNYSELTSDEEKIDMVLRYVVSLQAEHLYDKNQIAANMDATSYVKEIGEILLKLYKDGYVHTQNTMGLAPYVSNFDGRMFSKSGGYSAKASRDTATAEQQRIDAARLIDLENQNLIHSGQLNTLTHRLVVAAWFAFGAAAILFLWNVWIWFYPVHKDYPYWFWEKAPTVKAK